MNGMLTAAAHAGGVPHADYHCGFGDWGCIASETMTNWMLSTIQNFGNFIADMIVGAFDNPVSDTSWSVAHGQFLFWVAVMTPIIMIIAIGQVGVSAILQDWRRMGRTVLGAVLAVPFSVFAVHLMQQLSDVTDSVTSSLTSSLQGGHSGSVSDALLNSLGLVVKADAITTAHGQKIDMPEVGLLPHSWIGQSVEWAASANAATGVAVGGVLIMALMAIAALFLYIAMALRTFGLLVAAAMAPVALMMIGQPKLGAWAGRWANLTMGLLAAKPLAAGVLTLAVGLSGSASSLGFMLITGAAIAGAAFSPLWATKLVSFAGAEVGSALHSRPSVRNFAGRARMVTAPVRRVGGVAGKAVGGK